MFYLFENLALFFNLSKWSFAIRIMDPQVGYHKVKMAPKQKAIVVLLVVSSLGFYLAELNLSKPYPEVSLLLFQSCVINPIYFFWYIMTYYNMLRS